MMHGCFIGHCACVISISPLPQFSRLGTQMSYSFCVYIFGYSVLGLGFLFLTWSYMYMYTQVPMWEISCEFPFHFPPPTILTPCFLFHKLYTVWCVDIGICIFMYTHTHTHLWPHAMLIYSLVNQPVFPRAHARIRKIQSGSWDWIISWCKLQAKLAILYILSHSQEIGCTLLMYMWERTYETYGYIVYLPRKNASVKRLEWDCYGSPQLCIHNICGIRWITILQVLQIPQGFMY